MFGKKKAIISYKQSTLNHNSNSGFVIDTALSRGVANDDTEATKQKPIFNYNSLGQLFGCFCVKI